MVVHHTTPIRFAKLKGLHYFQANLKVSCVSPHTKSNPGFRTLGGHSVFDGAVQVLRQVVDELREEVQWANQNLPNERSDFGDRQVCSCSLDPTSPNFTADSVDRQTVDKLRSNVATPMRLPREQGKLFGVKTSPQRDNAKAASDHHCARRRFRYCMIGIA